jgi:hypothetical protein
MQVAEEDVAHIDGAMAAFDQPMMRARAMVHDEEIAADLEEIAGTLARQRRRGRSGAKQRNPHVVRRMGAGLQSSGGRQDE